MNGLPGRLAIPAVDKGYREGFLLKKNNHKLGIPGVKKTEIERVGQKVEEHHG